MSAPVRVLVVDDEPAIVEMLSTVLAFHGFEVIAAGTARDAETLVAEQAPDVLVLDVMLPDRNGFELCRRLRAAGHDQGVVFLTARDSSGDTVTGLSHGGDDYVTKPFSVDVLVARIRAVLRRTGTRTAPEDDVLRVADVELDEAACQVTRAGTPVPLSPTEYRLLRCLMAHRDRVLSRQQILQDVWGYDFGGASTVVDTYVGYLRRKLDPLGEPLVHTVRGFGYVLRTPKGA